MTGVLVMAAMSIRFRGGALVGMVPVRSPPVSLVMMMFGQPFTLRSNSAISLC